MYLNREHRFNTLSPHFIHQFKRSLETLNVDEEAKIILLTTMKGEHFSNGTDFRTIMHYKTNNEEQNLLQYINDLYSLQT
jgi:enoyl-CoA hydratase/carnithine racemase